MEGSEAVTSPPEGEPNGRPIAPEQWLSDRVESALARAAEHVGTDAPPVDGATIDQRLEIALEAVVAQFHELAARPRTPRVLVVCELALELRALLDEIRARRSQERWQALTHVQEALSRLRNVDSVSRMLDKATAEVCKSCNLDRALLFRVEGSELVAESLHMPQDQAWADEIMHFAKRNRPQLNHLLLETEMLRRRIPMLVPNAQDDPRTFKPIVQATQTSSYVAAPIMPEGRVIGFLHADCYFTEREVDELDRDTLWTFAEGFGYAVERTILLDRLRSQRQQISTMMQSTEAILNEMCDAEIELVRVDRGSAEVARTAAAMFIAPESRLESLLTRRELEVLGLMAQGATNAAIADRLVISEGTVKSHVKHVLRKLRAANRAEAVSRYMRLAAGAQRPA